MGKISNNLITEKALRPTRVNKAIENFIKAHGGKFTIWDPRIPPGHIEYTSSITSPSEYSPNGYVRVSRKAYKHTPGKGTRTYTTSMFDKDASRYVANALDKATGGQLLNKKEMSEKHFKETSAEPTSNSTVKNSAWNKLKNSKAGNWLKNTKVGGYFTDSPLTPMNVALTHKPHTGGLTIKGWRVGWDPRGPVAYAANAFGMGSGGGYMPVGEHTVDQLRIEHGQDGVSSLDTVVPMNPQGTMYLDPKLGFQPTVVLEDHEGRRYYKNAQTGHFEPLDYSPKDTYISADQLARNNIAKAKIANFNKTADSLNDIISGVIKNIPQDISKLPLPPVSADEGEIPSGTVKVGPDKEVPAQPVQSVQPANKPRRALKPPVVNNTPVTPVVNTPEVPTSNVSASVAAPTLSSVTSQAVRPNGGFNDYRRQSVLSALRAAGGISPAEAVQRGIIPWEALNYV